MESPRHQLETGNAGRRTAVAAGLVVVLAITLWFAFLRGGGAQQGEVLDPAAVAPAATEAPLEEDEEEQEPRRDRGQVETFEVFAGRDPFLPVVRTADAGAGAGTGADTGGDATASGAGGDTEQIGGHRVRLVSISGDGEPRAQVQVDSNVYTVSEGEEFAENFKLLSISGNCATMLFGDDQFTLCEGEEILK